MEESRWRRKDKNELMMRSIESTARSSDRVRHSHHRERLVYASDMNPLRQNGLGIVRWSRLDCPTLDLQSTSEP